MTDKEIRDMLDADMSVHDIVMAMIDRAVAAGEYEGCSTEMELAEPEYRRRVIFVRQAQALTPNFAAGLALAAWDRLQTPLRFACMALMSDETLREWVIDGSQFSPAWRKLEEGARVWELDEIGGHDGALCEAFEEQLDAEVSEWNGRNEETLVWDDGHLWVCGTEFDHGRL